MDTAESDGEGDNGGESLEQRGLVNAPAWLSDVMPEAQLSEDKKKVQKRWLPNMTSADLFDLYQEMHANHEDCASWSTWSRTWQRWQRILGNPPHANPGKV